MLDHGLTNAAGNALRIALAFVAVPILVHNLGLHDYGLLTFLIAVIDLGAFFEAGLSTSTTIYVARAMQSDKPKELNDAIAFVFAVALATAAIASLLIVFASPALASWLFADKQKPHHGLEASLFFATFAVLARIIFQVHIGLLHALQRFTTASALQTSWFYLTQLSLLVLSAGNHNFVSFSAAIAGSACLSAIAAWRCTRRHFALPMPRWDITPETRRSILQAMFDTGVTSVATTLFGRGDRLIVGAVLGPTHLGIYSTFANIAVQINSLSAATCQPLLAHISRLGSDAKQLANAAFSSAFLLCAITATGLGTGLILSIPILPHILFPTISSAYYSSLILLIWAYTLISLMATPYFALQAMQETRFVWKVTLSAAIIVLMAIGGLAVSFGLIGACIGNFGYLIIFAYMFKIWPRLPLSKVKVAVGLVCLLAPMVATWAWWTAIGSTNRILLLLAITLVLVSMLISFTRRAVEKITPSSRST
jgi:O-antigen/teichoic acid export membrane protein